MALPKESHRSAIVALAKESHCSAMALPERRALQHDGFTQKAK
jgi:hypothetical protein